MKQNKKLRLQITTPQKPVLDTEVDFVVLPAYDGEIGVLPGHTPYVTTLNFGELRYTIDGKEETFALMGGFAEIAKDEVSVFAEDIALAREVDEEAAKQKIEQAKASLSAKGADIDMELAEIELKKAILMLKVKKNKRKK